MHNLLIHDRSRAQLKALLNDPPHALIIVGANGTGKRAVATAWAQQLTKVVEVIEPDDKGTITIEVVRGLYKRTKGRREDYQVIIVDHAEAMGIEAQNAFLKLLEEPRPRVTFVLTAPSPDSLLPTITSRAQSTQLLTVDDAKLKEWATTHKSDVTAQELAQLLFVAQGRPALLQQLLESPPAFDTHRDLMLRAKQLMSASKYERLAMVGDLIKDRPSLITILEAMAHMTKLQLAKNPEKRWLQLADGLQLCLTRLAQNGNPRAQLLRLLVVY